MGTSRKAASLRTAASKLRARTAYLRDGVFPAGWCVTHQHMAPSVIASSPPPADEAGRTLKIRLAAHARADERLADLAAEPGGVCDDGVQVDVGGHAVERAAERHQRARVVGDFGVLGVVEDGPRVRQLTADLEERGELDRRGLAHRAPEQRPLDLRVEPVAVLEDVAGKLPAPRAWEGMLLGLGVEPVQQLRLVFDEEQHFGSDAVRGRPGAPVPGVDPDLQMDETVGERRRHAVHDATVVLRLPQAISEAPSGSSYSPHLRSSMSW